ncbi:MAG: DNA/RNA non-specific endonuclease, partial [Bacteroides sp.]|nr:DNA/RNA non-specific endonuclease [Bacteroides sp.]
FRTPILEQIEEVQEYFNEQIIRKEPALPKVEGLEIPRTLTPRKEQIITHTGYTVSYNEDWRLPSWVAYELTQEKVQGTVKRATKFIPDPQVKGAQAQNSDYTNSGYDRGHMAPAGDMKWSKQAMDESFFFSNICPQDRKLNGGRWKDVEEKVREWATADSAIVIVYGPIMGKKPKTLGTGKVAIPDAFYKVALSPYQSPLSAIGFIMKNENVRGKLQEYMVTIDSVETITGIDFFHLLPDEIEKKLESTLNIPLVFKN